MSKERRTAFGWWYAILPPIAIFVVVPATLVLAFWPTPDKYPLFVPIGLVPVALYAAHRYRNESDDFGAILVVLAALSGLAAMTIGHYLDFGVLATVGVWAALLALPSVALVLLLVMSGAASDPTVEYSEDDAS